MDSRSDFASEEVRRVRHRARGKGSNPYPWLATAILLGLLIIGAPLACGAVHRVAMLVVLGIATLLMLTTLWSMAHTRRNLPWAAALALPLFFLLTAAVQLIPLAGGFRGLIDPKGAALLALAGLKNAQPLSLDPPETYRELAKAAAAVCVTLASLALASGRRLRFVVSALVACGGIAAVVVGLGHRMVVEDAIYGHFHGGGGLLVGPFINANHNAEFLELAAFAALAFAYGRNSSDGRRLWQGIAAVLAAAAISTLSRGSLFALGSGALAWFLLAPRSDEGVPFHRSRFVGMLLGFLLVAGITICLGGDRIIEEFSGTVDENLSKLQVWWDALPMVLAHPAGIGLGAFGRAYPMYQTLAWPGWVQFVENQPISILVETGFLGAAILLVLGGFVARRFWREARRDRVEASLVAGLVAVLAHNLVDFGLETMGVLLPFCALLGMAFGRQADVEAAPASARKPVILAAAAVLSTIVAIGLLLAPATRDFDALLKLPPTTASRGLAHAASLAHPTDYVYALAEARLEPRNTNGSTTPSRLRLLNRAMLLCPLCIGAHQEAARDLWQLGRRKQSLLEWKIVVARSRAHLTSTLDQLLKHGATSDELASLGDDGNHYQVFQYLLAHGMIDTAKTMLNRDDRPKDFEFHLIVAQLALAEKDIAKAQAASRQALALAPREPRTSLLSAEIASLRPETKDEALSIVENGLRFSPTDVGLNRMRVSLLMPSDKWQAIDRAVAGLRIALVEAGAPGTEANIAAAAAFERRGQFRRAMSEYQAALSHAQNDVGLLLGLAKAAEASGAMSTAIDAYRGILRLSPENQEARGALDRIKLDKKLIEINSVLLPISGQENP
jgi:tetratricopeptide (TPR) repeat protein